MCIRTLSLLAGLFFLGSCSTGPTDLSNAPMGDGDADDPQGRRAWMLERLKDPATGTIPADIRRKELAFAKGLPERAGAKSLSWSWRGPKNRGGRTRAFAVDRTNTQRLLAGGVTGGMWLSTDAGLTWTKTTATGSIHSSSCITQDPRTGRENEWYYGSGENYGVVSGTSFSALLPGDGIFKSTDSGNSWTQLASTIAGDHENYTRNGSFKQVNNIVVDPTRNDSDVVLAAVFNGIFRSNDGGASWRPALGLDTTTSNVSTYSHLEVTPGGVYYAAIGTGSAERGIWRSVDGLSWTEITPSGFATNVERTVLTIDPSNDSLVWFFSNKSSGTGVAGHQLWRYRYLSGDGTGSGGQWSNRTTNLPNQSCTGYFTFDFGPINSQSGYDMCIAVHPDSSDIVFIGGTNVYRSTSGWSTPGTYDWIGGYRCNAVDPKDYVYPDHHPDQHLLVFDPADPSRLYSTNDGGVHVTYDPLADSVAWDELNTGYATSQFYTMHLDDGVAGDDRLLGGMQDNGMYASLTDDAADPWARVHQDDGAYGALPTGQNYILTSSQSGRLYKKTGDANLNITGFERIDPLGVTATYNFINAFALDPNDNDRIYWVAASRLWRNNEVSAIPITNEWYDKEDLGWEQLAGTAVPQRIACVDLSRASSERAVVGTINGYVWCFDSLLTGTITKTDISGDSMPNGYVSCVAPNDLDPDEWLVTFSNYGVRSIWHTPDTGATWTDVSGNLEEFPDGSGSGPAVFWALIYPTWGGVNDRYFVGTSVGLFSTAVLDGANTVWEQEGPATIGNVPINMITARNSDGLIAVGTHGNGAYSAHLPAAPFSVEEVATQDGIAAWPNPAHDQVTIALPSGASGTTVEVFDLHGRSVRRHGPVAGPTWTWDLRDANRSKVAPGTYLISVAGGDRSRSVRVVVE